MSEFGNIFEYISDNDTQLFNALQEELNTYITGEADQFWFDRSVHSGSAANEVLNWIEKKYPVEFDKIKMNPDLLNGNSLIGNALEALGLMKDWSQVSENDLNTENDLIQFKAYHETRPETD